jgi:2-dehydro-3-deoxygluconokinase
LLHLSGITPALGEQPRAAVRAALDHARSSGWTVSLDVNFRARLWSETEAGRVLGPIAARADVVIGSAEELALLSDGDLLDTEVREVVTKLGEHGASSRTAQGEWTAPAHPVAVVDPIGAGDAFTAGYLSALLAGLPTPARLARGNAAGACAVATSGDWEGLPTAAELDLLALADGEVLR